MIKKMGMVLTFVLALPVLAHASNDLVVGALVVDPPTYRCLGVSLPIVSGDQNYNASVSVAYRKLGTNAWREALPLMRVRPETVFRGDDANKNTDPLVAVPEQFAGSIVDLEPATSYEVKLTIQDPDGVNTSQILTTLDTRAMPPAEPATPRVVNVNSMAAWQAALDAAQPGDVIYVQNGTYAGALHVTRSGTPQNPIFIRGQSRNGVILNAVNAEEGVLVHTWKDGPPVENVTLENFTVTSSTLGIRILGTRNVVVQRMLITDVAHGINATTFVEEGRRSYSNDDLTITNNILQGKVVWPQNDQSVWNFEGIVLEGTGHVVSYNTLSGFGDSLGIEVCYGGINNGGHYCPLYPPPNADVIRNRSIDFYGNDILWGGDDGIELDFAERNVRAFDNRIANSSMGISIAPIWGGPVYAFRNVMYNIIDRIFKLNNYPTGFYIFHNTSIKNGIGMNQPSSTQQLNGMKFFNNLIVGTDSPTPSVLRLTTGLVMDFGTNNFVEMDYDGWYPNGTFVFLKDNLGMPPTYDEFGNSLYADLAALGAYTTFEHHGVALTPPIFRNADYVLGPISAPPLSAPDDFTPASSSGAIDAGVVLPNFNDNYRGSAPDLGAIEVGAPVPTYGAH
jgi:hypothetical protein